MSEREEFEAEERGYEAAFEDWRKRKEKKTQKQGAEPSSASQAPPRSSAAGTGGAAAGSAEQRPSTEPPDDHADHEEPGLDDEPIPLTIVQWSPHSLSATEPVAAGNAMRELKTLQAYLRLDLYAILRWRPSEQDVATLQFALSRGEIGWLREALLDSAFANIRRLVSGTADAAAHTPATDLAGAIEQLHDAILAAPDAQNRQLYREALVNYHRIAMRQVTGPVLRQAETASDPLERAMLLQFAQLNALFLEKSPGVRELVLRGVARPKESLKDGDDKSVSELLAISSQLVTLAKEMTKWNRTNPHSPAKRATSPTLNLSRRFGNSDSAMRN